MLRPSIVLVGLSALGVAMAQNFTINPANVDPGTRANWCGSEVDTCATLCANNPKDNSCSPDTLVFSCLCQNGSAPGLQYYLQTMPTFLCNEAFKECNQNNVGNAAAQANCTTTIQKTCGTLDPNKANIGSGSATTSGSTSPTTSPKTSTSKAAAPTYTPYYGHGAAAVAAGLFAYLV